MAPTVSVPSRTGRSTCMRMPSNSALGSALRSRAASNVKVCAGFVPGVYAASSAPSRVKRRALYTWPSTDSDLSVSAAALASPNASAPVLFEPTTSASVVTSRTRRRREAE